MEKITSKNNNYIKKTAKLFTSSSARKKNREFVLEGVRLCFDVINSDVNLKELYITEECYCKNKEKSDKLINISQKSFFIDKECADKLANTVNSQGVFCVCEMLDTDSKLDYSKKYIALENLQDPSNLGAVVRTAEALGIDGIILSGCVDIYNPKSLRASMGSMLRMNIIFADDLIYLLENCKNNKMQILATVPDSSVQDIVDIDMNGGVIAVIGNEGNGLSDAVKSAATSLVTIKMSGRTESLNAGVAASITMWEMKR